LRKNLDQIISEGVSFAERFHRISIDESQREGANSIGKAVDDGGISVGVGPPGTGKTHVFSLVMSEKYPGLDKDEVLIYVAPTNALVGEAAVRTIAYLVKNGFTERDLRNTIRVYGSHYEPLKLEDSVKIVFTTGYQPGALKKLVETKGRIHLFVDEASTTALHEAFMPLSMSLESMLMRRDDKILGFIGSFSVIGDPMQALIDPSYGWSWKIEQLVVSRLIMAQIPVDEREVVKQDPPKMFELAKKYIKSSSDIKYFFLDKTFRMPRPTELLVSIPFYNRMLAAARDYKETMKDVDIETSGSTLINNSKFLNRMGKIVEEAILSQLPVVYIKDPGAYYGPRTKGLDDYDERRAVLGAEIAAYMAYHTNLTRIAVIVPYNEMTSQIRFYIARRFRNYLGDKIRKISIRTVHSSLGLDSEAVIAILGKEYRGTEGFETIYYQSPELINVQFSRHMKILVVIGNIESLVEKMLNKHPYVSKLKESLEELKEKEVLKLARIPSN